MVGSAHVALQVEHLDRLLERRGTRLAIQVPKTKVTADDRERYEAVLAERTKTPKERATDLLLSVLNEQQRADFAARQEFTTTGSDGKLYLIRLGRAHNVFEVDAEGNRLVEICGHVRDNIPDEDNMAAQKLALEADAPAFLQTANSWALGPGGTR